MRLEKKEGMRGKGKEGNTWSFIRFLRAPVPTRIILLANSTPMVCEDRIRHSFFTKRCRRQDLCIPIQSTLCPLFFLFLSLSNIEKRYALSASTRTQKDDLRQVIVHAAQFLRFHQYILIYHLSSKVSQ